MHIYKFTHIESGRCYIGQTIQDPNRRRLEHISGSRTSDKTYHFHNALRKYGIDAFIFEILDNSAVTLEELNILEEKYVDQFNSINNGFNIRKPGDNKTHSPESIERMKESQRVAHARRREQNNGIEKHKEPSHKGKTGIWSYSEEKRKRHSEIMKEVNKNTSGGKTWKIIDGKRTWLTKEASV